MANTDAFIFSFPITDADTNIFALWRVVRDSSQSFLSDTPQGHRQNRVEVQPNWFINRKAEFSLVDSVVNKKGFVRWVKEEFSLVETISQWKEFNTLRAGLRYVRTPISA